jgi:hypothetical protein
MPIVAILDFSYWPDYFLQALTTIMCSVLSAIQQSIYFVLLLLFVIIILMAFQPSMLFMALVTEMPFLVFIPSLFQVLLDHFLCGSKKI